MDYKVPARAYIKKVVKEDNSPPIAQLCGAYWEETRLWGGQTLRVNG
jgi:hypothetical protein